MGPSMTLQVMPGDTVRMKVQAKYFKKAKSKDPIAGMASIVAASMGAGTISEAPQIAQGIQETLGLGQAGLVSKDNTIPKAYINYLFFDTENNFKKGGYKQVSEAALGSFEELDLEYVPEEEGTMMIYTANQTAEDLDVYMDDLTILHTEGPIIRVDDYYPFGLTYNSSERSGFTTNKRLFNGVEFQDELDLGLYQTLFRMYDPMLGRFIQIDPLADFFPGINPYNFGLDNPISFGDPDGLGPLDWLIGTKEERQNRRMSRRNARRSKAQKRRFERKHWVYSPSAKPKEDVKPKLVLSEIEPKRPEPSMDEGNLSLPDIVREVVPKPEPTIGGQPIEAGREIRFDHWPFGSNDYVVRDPSQTNKFLTPIADKLKSNPHLAITIQVLTNLTPDQLDENLATVHPDIKGNRLMWNRGSAIQLALINMGVDSRQIVFMYKPSVAKGAGGINIVVREK